MKKLAIKEVKPTRVTLQMADKSVRYAHGVVENVLVQIAPPDKSPKKKSKEDKGKSIDFEDTPTAFYIPYPSILVGSDNKASSKDASNHYFNPP
ncbi:hypothetical protein PIB30_109025 [Stylosanthes scabra]|uniref:Uncharacterized protein n=1 Tax=Stylosanthes scabra TaxID=79078 RepID=A0ABU6TZ29_9FABA|nr:hypothetical protein [Stylosanthes scabra]